MAKRRKKSRRSGGGKRGGIKSFFTWTCGIVLVGGAALGAFFGKDIINKIKPGTIA